MNERFDREGKQNNLLNEDFYHKLNSGKPNISVPRVETENYTIQRRSEKLGRWANVQRKVGKLLNKDWGYDVYEETVIEIKDIDKFRGNLESGLYSELIWLQECKAQNVAALENYHLTIERAIQARIDSIDEALSHTIPLKVLEQIVKEIHALKGTMEQLIISNSGKMLDQDVNQSTGTISTNEDNSEFAIDSLELRLMRFLNSASDRMYQFHLDELVNRVSEETRHKIIVCHWSQNSFSDFWMRYFPQVSMPNGQYSKKKIGNYAVTVIDDSINKPGDFESKLRNIDWANSSLFVLFSVSQIGFTQKQFFKSRVAKYMKRAKTMISVIADFSDFFEQENLDEYLVAFKDLLETGGLKPKHIVLNHDDIGLSKVIENLIIGGRHINNEREELEFISEMDKQGYFVNPNIKEIIVRLLRKWRNVTDAK